ncbi:MAG: hypothetical protein KTR15_03940 [Phycisphaeraceae bacterium]|nr:hypothetical protein [Phycisphaeraceae bacterium]
MPFMTRLPMTAFFVLLPLFLVCPTWVAAQEQSDEIRPVDAQEATGETQNGCAWTLTMARDFTTYDAVKLTGQLMNTSDQQFVFDTGEPYEGNPKIILTPKGEDPIAIELDHRTPGIGAGSGNYKPKPGEIVRGLKVDLRLLFGRLNPGAYTLQIVYPKDHYQIAQLPGYVPADISSPTIDFVVRETKLEDAKKAMPKPGPLVFTLNEREKPLDDNSAVTVLRAATLHNTGNKPIQIYAYIHDAKINHALPWTERWEQYHPEQGWYEGQVFGYCGTGLGLVTLKPNESVQIAINSFPSDGIYRYKIRYTADAELKQWQHAYSDLVVIDYFAQQYLKTDGIRDAP